MTPRAKALADPETNARLLHERYSGLRASSIAVALHRAYGWRLAVLVSPTEHYRAGGADVMAVVHAAAVDGDTAWDIRGRRPLADLCAEVTAWSGKACEIDMVGDEAGLARYVTHWVDEPGRAKHMRVLPLNPIETRDIAEATRAADKALGRLEGYGAVVKKVRLTSAS